MWLRQIRTSSFQFQRPMDAADRRNIGFLQHRENKDSITSFLWPFWIMREFSKQEEHVNNVVRVGHECQIRTLGNLICLWHLPGWFAVPFPSPFRLTSAETKTYFFNKSEKRFPVIFPFQFKLRCWWVFAAGKLKGDLKAVGPHIVIILHAT